MIEDKRKFFELPVLKCRSDDATFVAQVFFCTYDARTPSECDFFVSNSTKVVARPKCPHHPNETVSWANLYDVAGTQHRYHV